MTYKAVIFDLDGTLLNTIDDLADSMNSVLSSHGFPTHETSRYKYFVGDGMRNLVKRALPEGIYEDSEIDTYFKLMKENYAKNWSIKSKPYEGIAEMLDTLEKLCIPKAVLSNKAHEFTVDVVNTLLPNWSFDCVFGEREGVTRKPDPSGALEVSHSLGISPSQILFVGDSSTDMMTAKNAGMFAVGVLWGFREKDELLKHGADALISEPMELIKLFE